MILSDLQRFWIRIAASAAHLLLEEPRPRPLPSRRLLLRRPPPSRRRRLVCVFVCVLAIAVVRLSSSVVLLVFVLQLAFVLLSRPRPRLSRPRLSLSLSSFSITSFQHPLLCARSRLHFFSSTCAPLSLPWRPTSLPGPWPALLASSSDTQPTPSRFAHSRPSRDAPCTLERPLLTSS